MKEQKYNVAQPSSETKRVAESISLNMLMAQKLFRHYAGTDENHRNS